MRCGRCGNENAEANRFCGMCGAPLLAKTPVAERTGQAPAVGPASGSAPAERRPAAVTLSGDEPKTGPVITGHSFLGLNMPATGGRAGEHADHTAGTHAAGSRGDAGHDPLRPSSNLDYLLEDEEPPKRGAGKLIVVVVALLLAVGFGYLHWKQGGFDWLNAGEKKPAAATPAPEATPNGADSGGTTGTAANGATPAGGASGAGTAPGTGGAAVNPTDSTAPQANPAPSSSEATSSQGAPSQTAAPPSVAPPGKAGDSGAAADAAPPVPGSDSAGKSPAVEQPARAKTDARKPAKPGAAKPADPVTTAERYIYGRGVRQDCDHGMRLLKRATEQSNAKAMISMGAVYSTGTCTPRDLPTAYRWFALALHQDPDNQALQDDLQKLWSQMTQPERQMAIKLSQ